MGVEEHARRQVRRRRVLLQVNLPSMGTTTIRSSRIFAQKVSNRSGVEAETEAAQIFSFSFVNGAEVVMARLEECQSRRHAWKQKSREKQRSGKRRENLWDFEGIDLLQGHLELFQLHLDTKILGGQEKSIFPSVFFRGQEKLGGPASICSPFYGRACRWAVLGEIKT